MPNSHHGTMLRTIRLVRTWIAVLALLAASCSAADVMVGHGGAPIPGGLFGPPSFAVQLLDGRTDEVLAGTVHSPSGTHTVDDLIVWDDAGLSITVEAEGFHPRTIELNERPGRRLDVRLDPIVVTGLVVGLGERPLVGATVTLGDQTVTSGPEGRFRIERAAAGPLTIERAGYEVGTFDFSLDPIVARMAPAVARGISVGGPAVGDPERWAELLDLAARTEVNMFVVDIKDESGAVYFDTSVDLAHAVGAVDVRYDPAEVAADMREAGLYLVGRIVTFQDPRAARSRPEIAVWDSATEAPYRSGYQYFLDPTDAGARGYALDLAVDACRQGFDEIQFDYVRYPDGYGESAVFDGGSEPDTRQEAIRTFLLEAGRLLHPLGCAVAADIFGFITTVSGDGGIGQQLEALANTVDVLSPMLYPSHYSRGWFGYDSPVSNPGGVVGAALDDGLERVEGQVIIRPWIQDFSYTTSQVREQIDAADERQLGWMLWNALSEFTEDALAPDG